MTKLQTLHDGLVEQLRDLYSAENQLVKALPKLEKKASNEQLKKAFRGHLVETKNHVERLDKVGAILDVKLTGKTCKAMLGLIEEGKEVLEAESENAALVDALLICAAQRVEHYEIAAYGGVRSMAQELDLAEVTRLFGETLGEEQEASKTLTLIAEGGVLSDAHSEEEREVDDDDKAITLAKRNRTKSKAAHMGKMFGLITCLWLSREILTPLTYADAESQPVKNEKAAAKYTSDNSGHNIRDRNLSRMTADDQRLAGPGVEVLARIRREIVANKTLSTNAHNVKILVEKGQVLLRGPVNSAQERTWKTAATTRVTPGYVVVDQLEVAPG